MKEYIAARSAYIQLIRQEMLGPGSEISLPDAAHELISCPPEKRYSIGILFPQNHKNDDDLTGSELPEEDTEEEAVPDSYRVSYEEEELHDENSDMNPDHNLDEEVNLASQNMPSSFGMTFFVRGNAEQITCQVSFGTYRRAKASDCKYPFHPDSSGEFNVSPFLRSMVYFDKEIQCLRYVGNAIPRKEVRSQSEKVKSDYEKDVCDAMYALDLQARNGYVREPFCETVVLDFHGQDYLKTDDCPAIGDSSLKLTALKRQISGDLYSVTIMGVNTAQMPSKQTGLYCLFQPEIRVTSKDNPFVFVDCRTEQMFSHLSEEDQSLAMQYRHKHHYGTGMGTSVKWEIDDAGCGKLYTDFFPEEEIPRVCFSLPEEAGVPETAFSMKYLSDLEQTPPADKLSLLRTIVDAYDAWIQNLSEKARSLEAQYQQIAQKHISDCGAACQRMYDGLSILGQNHDAWTAFSLANRAMYMQRVHLKLQSQLSDKPRYPDDEELEERLENLDYRTADQTYADPYAWRPFQIAFLLMSIASVTDPDSEDRNLIDLIWFPTGGGKTEAYLGLTAMTIFYRRLHYPDTSGGTTVMMRYTMRLLTAQQFTRAATLICACEYIRTNKESQYPHYALGDEPITIGLWIGREHTPNKTKGEADTLVRELESVRKPGDLQYRLNTSNKFQLLKCPWCGTMLTKGISDKKLVGDWGYKINKKGRFVLRCPNETCFFDNAQKLPIQVVDEELYREPPTLLFATVDKFAMLPFYEEIGHFFGTRSRNRTPELIIQDELHLIAGPLGTIVGLYETAIEALCSAKGVRTKIIASTATIRCAKEQCAALYDRDVKQFPPPGLDAEDSFFAREETIDYEQGRFGRMYVGLLPSGGNKAMTEISAAAALLQRMETIRLPDTVKDAYWTLTMYFNSLKDLGYCESMLAEDIPFNIQRIYQRDSERQRQRYLRRIDKLTSREPTTRLNETMERLEKTCYTSDKNEHSGTATDVVLATNMISVGIDIPRLNSMLIVGQPKLTNEYIQASSRIGRRYPGVAFVIYDSARSRDRSHFEQFHAYHQTLYRFVEPTSATPFSRPARERALHAVLISILRHRISEIADEKEAGKFCKGIAPDIIKQTKEEIVQRAASVLQRTFPGAVDESDAIRNELDEIIERWCDIAERFGEDKLYYGKKFLFSAPKEESGEGRLLKDFQYKTTEPAFKTMTSMRNVDVIVEGELLIWGDEEHDAS